MELISFELGGRTIVFVILAWLVHMAINKLVQTLRNGDPNPVKKDDPAELSRVSSPNELSPLVSEKDDPAELSRVSSSNELSPLVSEKDDPASLPSSSAESRPPHAYKHDVFLSFRGTDTRRGITSDLYVELQNRGIKTYMDAHNLVLGSAISPSLLTAIEESKFAIIVLSQNYASSRWCLEELTKIVHSMDDENRILPLFYDVEPSIVRSQKKSYEVAFKKHEKSSTQDTEKLIQWRDALRKVANLSGWDSSSFKTDRELVKDIVDFVYSRVRPTEYEWTMFTKDFEAFESTRETINKVMKALNDDEVTAVGVYGMGGVGKTTLVTHVGDQAFKIGIFHHVTMTVVSQNPDLTKIQGTLADLLGITLGEESEMGRATRLSKEILRRNKILIILDDIWNMIELTSIGIPSYDKLKACNSKVLFTTRRLQICHSMDCHANIPVNILSEEDSWNLFVKKTGRSFGEESSKFYEVARNVARECGGLPVALIAVARALGDKDLVEWRKACQRLKNSQVANYDDEGDVFKCIKLSYDYLKDKDCKSCFLLCCLFPEDYNIPVEYLLKYGFGKGLFRDADTFKEARGVVESVVKHLKSSSLLMDSEFETKSGGQCVKMHDVIRDTAIQIAQDWLFVRAGLNLKDWPRGLHEGCSAVSLMMNDFDHLPKHLSFPKLQILLLQCNDFQEIPETTFQSLNELKVLDLSATSISKLPRSSSLLTNLQALYLDYCEELRDISVVSKLEKLEILSMQSYNSKELPREIGDLTNLRILDFSGAKISRIPSKVISKLHRVEELYMNCGFRNWGSSVEGQEPNASFEEVISLSNLRVVQVRISHAECIPKTIKTEPNWVEFDISIGRVSTAAHLSWLSSRRMVEIYRASTLPDWFFRVVIYKAEKLSWTSNLRLADIFVEYEPGKFHGLKYLSIGGFYLKVRIPIRYGHMGRGDRNQSHNWHSRMELQKDPVLENLEVLHLRNLFPGEELCIYELPPGSLRNLKILDVSYCKNWGNVVFPAKLLNRLPNLEKLSAEYMLGADYVFGGEDFLLVQSKFRMMKLNSLDAVRSICDGPAPHVMFQTLQHLDIYDCGFHGSLFTSEVAHCLVHLEKLQLDDCPSLQRLVEACNNKIILPKLKILNLVDLPELCYDNATVDIECPSLGLLNVKNCPKFSVVVSDFRTGPAFQQAEEY